MQLFRRSPDELRNPLAPRHRRRVVARYTNDDAERIWIVLAPNGELHRWVRNVTARIWVEQGRLIFTPTRRVNIPLARVEPALRRSS